MNNAEIINTLLDTDKSAHAVTNDIGNNLFPTEFNPDFHAKKLVKIAISEIKDVEIAKKLAIKFDNEFELIDMESVLTELIGEDAWCDFADENDLA